MEILTIKHKFITMYISSTNGLLKRTNKTLYSMIAKETDTKANTSDWDLNIHNAMRVYNSIFKTATRFFPFHLANGIKDFVSHEIRTHDSKTDTKTRLDLDESQQSRLVKLIELNEVQLRARHVIKVA